jgi:hypothetical protein
MSKFQLIEVEKKANFPQNWGKCFIILKSSLLLIGEYSMLQVELIHQFL